MLLEVIIGATIGYLGKSWIDRKDTALRELGRPTITQRVVGRLKEVGEAMRDGWNESDREEDKERS